MEKPGSQEEDVQIKKGVDEVKNLSGKPWICSMSGVSFLLE